MRRKNRVVKPPPDGLDPDAANITIVNNHTSRWEQLPQQSEDASVVEPANLENAEQGSSEVEVPTADTENSSGVNVDSVENLLYNMYSEKGSDNLPEEQNQIQRENSDLGDDSDKGKSKGFVNTNVEQSWNNVEPEIENDNVQGTHQSPSNDNAENEHVQNVNDTPSDANINAAEGNEAAVESSEKSVVVESEQSNVEETFESEYTQAKENESSAERSTTPEMRPKEVPRGPSEDENKVKEKKRISLRRGSPKEMLPDREENPEAKKESRVKKIVLKRLTTEEEVVPSTSRQGNENADVDKNEREGEGTSRLSSTEEKPETEDVSKKPAKKIKLVRNISLESKDSDTSKPPHKPSWGRSKWLSNITGSSYKIDVDSIKTVCPTVSFLKEGEVKLVPAPRERTKSETAQIIRRTLSIDQSEDDNDKRSSEEEEESSSEEVHKENIIALNRKISIVDDTASKLRPSSSPAKNPVSKVLFISNLVRPFTVKQLKELLERTGKIRQDGFWTDRIKSKCYAHYMTVEEAEATRNALHGVNWPIGNGKQLVIDYATVEDMEKAMRPAPPPAPPVVIEKYPEKENREPERFEERHRDKEHEDKRRYTPERKRDRTREEVVVVRRRSRSRSRSRGRGRKYSHRSHTPDIRTIKRSKREDEPVPQKLMDDLFLKTKATPSVYWQPLSPEEIAEKQKQRMLHMEEHKRRVEENRERRLRTNRRIFRRH